MADFLYNGVELPDINTVWTDKETFPYAVIFGATSAEASQGIKYTAWGFSSLGSYDGASFIVENSFAAGFYITNDSESWTFVGVSTEFGQREVDAVPLWSNHDILNPDGSVYLSASTPIRVDSKLKISVGDGMTLYNSVLLPPLPEYDKAVYPYATIFRTASDPTFMLVLTSQPQIISDNKLTCTSDFAIDVYYSFAATNYTEFGHYEAFPLQVSALWNIATTSLLDQSWAWANHGVLLPDSSVLVPASEPVPCFPKVYYEGTEPCAYSSVFGAYVSSELLNEPGPSVGDTVYTMWDGVLYEDVVTTAATFGNAPMFGDLTLSTRPYVIGYMDIDGNGEAGWFFATGTSGEHTLRVYAVVEGGEVTATTADVTFTCTNLENTEPIDSIYAWVYKKSDGLNTNIPPTWTSEMFSAPAFSTTHTFKGLTPNTEYEVYGCIFVSGEATDHNAAASFTTIEGGGGDSGGGDTSTTQKHYCRVNGSVHEVEGGTARVSGSYHEIEVGTVRIEGAYYEIGFDGSIGGGEGGGDEGGGSLGNGVLFNQGEASVAVQYVAVNPTSAAVSLQPSGGIENGYIYASCGQGQMAVGSTTATTPIYMVVNVGAVDFSGYSTLRMTVSANSSVILGYGSAVSAAQAANITDSVKCSVSGIDSRDELAMDIGSVSGDQYVKFYTEAPNTTVRAYKIWLE